MFDDTQEFLKLAGKNAAKAAEDYITRNLFDAAIQSMTAAKDLNPELTAMAENYTAAYKVQQAVHLKQSLYNILGLEDVKAGRDEIKKRFKKMALVLHPDKNGSVVAEAAFKSVSNAYEVISDEKKRLAYDNRMGFIPPPKRSRPEARTAGDDFDEYMKSQGWKKAEAKPSSSPPSYPFKAAQPQPQPRRATTTSRCSCCGRAANPQRSTTTPVA